MPGAMGPGAFLRERREAKGLTVADVSSATRIAPRLLNALEQDRLEALPAPVFVRGFIRAYCATVDAPVDDALRLYEAKSPPPPAYPPAAPAVPPPAQTTAVPRPAPRPAPARPAPARPAPPTLRPVILAAGVAIILASAAGYYLVVSGETPHAAAPAPQPDPAPVLNASAVGAPVAAPAAPPAPVARVLVMRAHDATWVKVSTQDAPPSEALLQPGSVREWRSPGRFTVTIGNAGGVVLELDGVTLPPLGQPGEVVRDLTLPADPQS